MGVVKKAFKLLKKSLIPEVQQYLKSWNPKLQQDEMGNLYLINEGTPLVCAHMDTVRGKDDVDKIESIKYYKDTRINQPERTIIKGDNIVLGADDRAGCAVAMQMYEELGDKISLLFTVGEETGGIGSTFFVKHSLELLEKCTYCIVPDRKGDSDLICSHNDYGSEKFEDEVLEHLGLFGFKSVVGVWSDADQLSDVMNCFNISIGYYDQHTSREILVPTELEHSTKALVYLVENYNNKLPPPDKTVSHYRQYNSHNYYSTGFGYDDDDYPPIAKDFSMANRGRTYSLDGPILTINKTTYLYDSNGEIVVLEPDTYYLETAGYDNEALGYDDDDIIDTDDDDVLVSQYELA